MTCQALPDAFLEARLAGAVESRIHWSAADMDCEGMRRPDGQGLRVRFSGADGGGRLTLVFGVPHLAEGTGGRAIPVNVTLIREGGAVYGTRGDTKCVLDQVSQLALAADAADPAGDKPAHAPWRRWRIDARGFCLEPARAVGDGRDAILLATFDFRGLLTWEPDPPPAAEPAPPPATP